MSDSEAFEDAKSPPTKRHRRSSRFSNDDSGTDNKREELKHSIVENLQICTHVVYLCVSHPKKVFSPSDLLACARNLHDNLVLFEFDEVLMSEIACLCEEWWKEDLPEREALISLSMPLLLSRSLTLKRKVDVHRVYALREAFTCFDYDDESIEDMKRFLLRCYIEPLYLKTEDGKKFLSFLFELDTQLVKEALVMIRSQISTGRKSTLEAYAEIVFKAWKVVEDEESKYDIEIRFLQELIDSCIHASSEQFSASIRRILGGFISQRTNRDVEKLLFHLSEPLIFRSLEVCYLFSSAPVIFIDVPAVLYFDCLLLKARKQGFLGDPTYPCLVSLDTRISVADTGILVQSIIILLVLRASPVLDARDHCSVFSCTYIYTSTKYNNTGYV